MIRNNTDGGSAKTMSADLHIQQFYSDGCTPEEVVEKARGLHLKAIAITDHDTVDGITPALNAPRIYRFRDNSWN